MSLDSRPDLPEPWQDPEFAPFPDPGHLQQAKGSPGLRPERLAKALGDRSLARHASLLWLILAALFLGFLFDEFMGPVILFTLAAIGLGLAVLAGAMALGMAGTGLFAVGDRLFAWLKKGSRWPEH